MRELLRGGGGQQLRRVGFGAKNGDCGARAAVTYAKYAPLHALAKHHFYHPNPTASDFTPKHTQSTDSISKILESKSGNKSHKTRRSCSFFSKSTASKFKLESAFSLSSRASEAFFLSSRADEVGVAIHTSRLESTLTKLDSSISAFLNLIYFTQAHFLAVFFSPFLWLIGLTPRSFMRPLLLAPCGAIEKMDCHADFQSARNDRNNATTQKVDSRNKAQPTLHDSKHCSGAVVALRDFGGRARLEVCGCPQNRAINRIAYPRLNRRQRQKHLISFLKESL
ncbi:hypothetical protein NYG90_05060 [Helicobacter sp. XJK30-2]|uniref:Uncharacterized protein n=1 Tax=Helicobacter zhangjianzhongii TaxID=2974574 RepID=A0ACC6FS42_9HELI|nr:hypothetical protein [Helicobacter sp. XJK30-2]MDL0082046.1 hypothetical protein [Helicobacter sp. XJK30-2]